MEEFKNLSVNNSCIAHLNFLCCSFNTSHTTCRSYTGTSQIKP